MLTDTDSPLFKVQTPSLCHPTLWPAAHLRHFIQVEES